MLSSSIRSVPQEGLELGSGVVEQESVRACCRWCHGGTREYEVQISRITRSVQSQCSEQYILPAVGVHVFHDIEPSPTNFSLVKFEHIPVHQHETSMFRRFPESLGHHSLIGRYHPP